jgi:hypothetical protein
MSVTNLDSVEVSNSVVVNSGSSMASTKVAYKVAKVVVSSAQVLSLNASPVTLVSAPGSGKMLVFDEAVVHKPAGTAYAGIEAGDDLAIKYSNASGAQVNTTLEVTGFMDQTTAQTRITRPIATEYTPAENAPLVLHMLNSEITTGDSPLYVTISYHVVEGYSVANK